MEAKEKKKQEEMEVKEARKKERAEKKQQREEEAKRKAQEKERKAAERERIQAEKKRKAEAREAERKRKAESSHQKRPLSSHNKENVPSIGISVSKSGDESECAVCLGRYEDDITDGILQKEWVRCMNITSCGVWMHCDCLSTEDNSYVCYICNVVLK